MTFGSKFWANSKRLASFVLVAFLCLAATGCGGCGDSPSSKLARFDLSRNTGDDEETPAPEKKAPAAPAEKPAEKKKPAAAKSAPANKPAEKPAAVAAPAPQTPAQPAAATETPEASPATATTPPEISTNQISGARDRFAILEGFKLQPVHGDREQTKTRTRAVLHLLGQALAQQIADTQTIPAGSPPDKQGRQLLSWRVHLLPYLGYTDLYNKFKLDEPWNSPHNIKLSGEKPYAFTTPDMPDDQTNFVLVTGPTCAVNERLANPVSSLSPRSLHNTIVVVEVADPAMRVVWTKPDDLKFNPAEPAEGITGWPDNKFFALTADGVVHDLPLLSNDHLNRLFVVSNPVNLSEIASAAPAVSAVSPEPGANISMTTSTSPLADPVTRNDLDPSKLPLPSTMELDAATVELRRLFQKETREANTDSAKAAIADKLIQHSKYLKNDPTKQCAALQIAYRFGVLAKSPILVKDAFDLLQANYQVDSFSSDMFIIQFGAKHIQRIPAHRLPEFREIASSILDRAVNEHNFPAIDKLIEVGTYYAASQNDQATIDQLAQQKQKVEAARKDYDAIQAKYLSLEVPSLDEAGNLMVGKYWCVHRENWEKGFQFLMRSNDERFEYLAETELTSPIDPRIQFKIAEGWWEVGISSPPGAERNKFLGRAAQWYKLADANMNDSIEKVTAQQRIQEFTRLTGITNIPDLR